jgi:hypothetical protein
MDNKEKRSWKRRGRRRVYVDRREMEIPSGERFSWRNKWVDRWDKWNCGEGRGAEEEATWYGRQKEKGLSLNGPRLQQSRALLGVDHAVVGGAKQKSFDVGGG